MKNSQSENLANDVFEGEAEVRRLFEQSTPVGPSVDLENLASPDNCREAVVQRRQLFTPQRALTTAGIISCAIAVFAIVWLRPTATFAQVQKVVAATKSVRYTGRPLGNTANDDRRMAENIITESKSRLKQIEEKLKSTSDENEKERLKSELGNATDFMKRAERYLEKRGNRPPATRFYVLGRYRQRQERSGINGDIVDITNMKTGKSVHINHDEKTLTVFTKQTVISRNGKKTESKIKQTPDLTVDFYNQIRNVPKTATKLSETKFINGRSHIGFRTSKKEGPYTWTRTFWVDAETKLPQQIEISARSEDKFYGPTDAVIEDIEFDVPLDEGLFSTDTPAGYTVKESGLMSLE